VTARPGLVLAVVSALVLTSCAGSISRGSFDAEVQARGGGLGSDLPLDALDALDDELEGELALHSMAISPSLATIEVRVPGTEDELDSYHYGTSGLYGGGELSDPTPMAAATAGGPLGPTLFRPERIAFDRLDEVVDEAIDEADLEDGYAQDILINRNPGERPTITVTVANERDHVSVTFSADGEPTPA
jgi:hypothetical protein